MSTNRIDQPWNGSSDIMGDLDAIAREWNLQPPLKLDELVVPIAGCTFRIELPAYLNRKDFNAVRSGEKVLVGTIPMTPIVADLVAKRLAEMADLV